MGALRDFRYKLLDEAFNNEGKLPRQMNLPVSKFQEVLRELEEESPYWMHYRGKNYYFTVLGVIVYPEVGAR